MFNDVIVTEGECVCVELVAHDRYRCSEAVIFLGSIRYDVLKKLYDSRVCIFICFNLTPDLVFDISVMFSILSYKKF